LPPIETVLRKRRLLITGGTGFLGKVLLSILLRHHPEIGRIFLLIRGDRKSSLNRFRREILDSAALGPVREYLGASFDRYVEEHVAVIAGDITEPGLVTDGAELLEGAPLDAVIHCAGLVNFEASLEKALAINVTGVDHVIAFCRKYQAALLHVSTCYAAGAADGHRYEDDAPVDWAPLNQNAFKLSREIRDALAASPGSKANRATRPIKPNFILPIRTTRLASPPTAAATSMSRGANNGLKNGSNKSGASARSAGAGPILTATRRASASSSCSPQAIRSRLRLRVPR
jgi:hypothetical protein